MNAKSIYDNLINVQGVPSSILTYSDKGDCIIIEIQDYNKSVFKFAKEFFKGYKSIDIIYTNEDKTAVWYNGVSVYSDRETIQSITDFYYRAKVKGLVESKESARKSIKESDDNWYKLKMLNELLDAMEEDEYNIPKLGIYGVTKNIDLDEGAIRALIKYYK